MGYSRPRTYTLGSASGASVNPIDTTTYYMGGPYTTFGTTSNRRILIPKSGFIRVAQVSIHSNTATGTAEDWVLSLNDGTTVTDIATVGAAVEVRTWLNTNMNYRVTEGGYVNIKTTTPAWVTNPEGCFVLIHLIVEYE